MRHSTTASTLLNFDRTPSRPSAMVQLLTPIWQRVLQLSAIEADVNFFSAGGNLSSADQLFEEIARECGRELPSATIYQAQTIRELAGILEEPVLPKLSPCVLVKPGHAELPILIPHGVTGNVQCFQLASHIQTEHPVYGILARGLDGLDPPLDRIEGMAEHHIRSIKDFQPHGPYVLIGYSFGGLLALEIARGLCAQKEVVALLALVDTYPHPRFLSPAQRIRLAGRRAKRHFSEIKQRTASEAFHYLISGLEHRLRGATNHGHESPHPRAGRLSFARAIPRVEESAFVALSRYRPGPYPGKIKFVKSERDLYFPGNPVAIWAGLSQGIEIETVPGSHLDMVCTHYQALAAVLTRFLNEALSHP